MRVDITTIGALTLLATSCSGEGASERMNVILIMTDDQGYGDMSCHGNPYLNTPHLDALHSQSVRLENYHCGTTSAPTRASLMSGMYCNATGVWHTIMGRSLLTLDYATLPELMREGGYTTSIFGKWHLGDNYPYRPEHRGFDEALTHGAGGLGQGPDYWGNTGYDDTYFRNGVPEKMEGYCTDVWFDEAMSFIERSGDQPFFCYISPNAPHAPFSVEKRYADPFIGAEGVVNPYFNGMIVNIDENVGRLVQYLKDKGLYDNTILIFTTDNGTTAGVEIDEEGHVVNGYGAGMRGKKSGPYEGGHRVPFIMRLPGHEPCDITSLTGSIDVLPTLLDLCGMGEAIPEGLDGISFTPLLEGQQNSSRYMFADTQRQEFLERGRISCVMLDNWRLINGVELYNLESDPSQRNDIAAQHPDIVAQMGKAYDEWWVESSRRGELYEMLVIGEEGADGTVLNTHDLHTNNGSSAFGQRQVRGCQHSSGFWAIRAKESRDYRFSLYRWPNYLSLPICEAAPAVPNNWGYNGAFSAGKRISNIARAELVVDGEVVATKSVDDSLPCVEFNHTLEAGDYQIAANFILSSGEKFSCYYFKIKGSSKN